MSTSACVAIAEPCSGRERTRQDPRSGNTCALARPPCEEAARGSSAGIGAHRVHQRVRWRCQCPSRRRQRCRGRRRRHRTTPLSGGARSRHPSCGPPGSCTLPCSLCRSSGSPQRGHRRPASQHRPWAASTWHPACAAAIAALSRRGRR